jgi:hypothetical protein
VRTGRRNKSKRSIGVRLAYEMLLSLNISWLLVWYERQRNILSRIPIVGKLLNSYLWRLYVGSHMTEPQTTLDQVAWSVLVAVCLFLIFHLLGSFAPTTIVLKAVGGAIAVAGLPLSGLLYPLLFLEPYTPDPSTLQGQFAVDERWLILEATVALICALLYYFRKWPVPMPVSVLILGLHFGLWAWVSGNYVSPLVEAKYSAVLSFRFWMSTMYYWGATALGFLATASWGAFVRLTDDPPTASVAIGGLEI